MHHVIFEVLPAADGREPYLAMAARLRPLMEASGGCLTLERFDCVSEPGWMLSMQRWADEASLERWRAQGDHCTAQRAGRDRLFDDYRLRVATRLGHGATRAVSAGPLPAADLDTALQRQAPRTVAILEWTASGDADGQRAAHADSDVAALLANPPAGSRRYRAILDPSRHALVTPNAVATDGAAVADQARWCRAVARAAQAAGLDFVLSLAAVDRDYSRFERAEAPIAWS